jgi:hypothetical protein
MKQDIYYSDYTGRTKRSYEEWYDKAHTRVTQVLDRQASDAEPPPEINERLEAIEARLREDNQSWRTGQAAWWSPYIQDL